MAEAGRNRHPVVSVDDHFIEPPDTFAGRLPSRLADAGPRLVEAAESALRSKLGFDKFDPERNPVIAGTDRDAGRGPRHAWSLEGELFPIYGMDSCAGRDPSTWGMRPLRLDEIRRGSWDVRARLDDMDRAAIHASVNFPSMWIGFCGTTFLRRRDPELGLALVRAWNDWHLEAWCAAAPDRFIPLQLPCLWDPVLGAREVRENAARGFRAVSFSEDPTGQGLPSIHSGHWDPFLAACEETGTVVCLHGGSSGHTLDTTPDAPLEVTQSLFPVGAACVAVDWVWSRVPVRFPDIKIALSEGGVGWLPVVADWMDHVYRTHNEWTHGWDGVDLLPSEVLWRNFWFCAIDEPRGVGAVAASLGTERIVMEVDYPHADTSWPRTQDVLEAYGATLGADQICAVAHANACALFSHPEPVCPPPAAPATARL